MECQEAIPLMHDYLDGDMQSAERRKLKEHILGCPDCRRRLQRMERAEALVRSMPAPRASDDLTARIMNSLPQKKRRTWIRWVRNHPAISVAAVFILVMMSSFVSLWDQETDLMVKGNDLDQVVIRGNTVYVPEDKVVNGDLVVENGEIEVDGRVEGSVVVIDGKINQASTAHISGQVTRVNQALDYVWYRFAGVFSKVSQAF